MWNPTIAHLFHLKRADMLDTRLDEFLSMNDAANRQAKAAR